MPDTDLLAATKRRMSRLSNAPLGQEPMSAQVVVCASRQVERSNDVAGAPAKDAGIAAYPVDTVQAAGSCERTMMRRTVDFLLDLDLIRNLSVEAAAWQEASQ